jgi:hypothetical protein
MNRRYVVAVIFLGIAACATSGPQSPTPVASAGSSATDSKPTTPAGEVEIVANPFGEHKIGEGGQGEVRGAPQISG